jgi:BirA family transcriptional regulator, biotin operon repressor / biotin---[acetyl-CoA-carboxylase] ligase
LKANIIRLPETGSTNTYAISLLSKERPDEGCVIITDHQTQGKGTNTNTWESEKGKNLTFSLFLYPDFKAELQFVLNKAISLGICDFLHAELPQNEITIKWPNDIYIGNKKVCGILIQNSVIGNRLDYVVVGIGLNVNQTIFTSDAPNPVSLKMVTGKDYNLDELLHKLLDSIFEKYSKVKPDMSREIENNYRKKLYRLMEWHEYILKNTETIARITGSNSFGQLELETKNGQVFTCDLKEVKFII